METPKIEPFEKPSDNLLNGKEEYNKNRTRIFNQLVNYKETFKEVLHNIEYQFIKPYEDYLNNLENKLKEYDILIEKDIESTNLKNECYLEINKLLNEILKEKTNQYQNYINEIKKHTQDFINIIVMNNFSKGDEFIKKMLNDQKELKEKEKEKLEQQKKINEEQNYLDIYIKNKNKPKIEIDGEKDEKDNLRSLDNAVDYNYEKIILAKMSKARFELLFSQSSSIHSKLHNINNSSDNFSDTIERANTIKSLSGEPAPGAILQINNMTNTGLNESNKKITDISIIDSNLEDVDFANYFPDIENLEIINTKVSYTLEKNLNFEKINSLKLEGVGLINENFNSLFEQLRKNEIMRQNLRVLSVKNNFISFLDYTKGYADNILKQMSFKNLELLDMSYNKLILFQNKIFNSLENIKVIDLTYNNISFPTNLNDLLKAAKSKKCLVLMTKNLAILKDKANIDYNNYLVDIIPRIKYPLENLTLDNIFCNNNFQIIFKIDIGKFKISLEYLNLSNGQLKDDNLISLLKEKWDLPYLKYFILNSNYLTEKFIYSLIDKEYNFIKKFSNLKTLTLSDNKISCSDVNKFKEFLETYKNIDILELKNTPIENVINQFFRKKVMKHYDTDNTKGSIHAYNSDEKKIEQIFDDKNIKNKINITIKINDLIFSKYTKTIVSHLSYLLERITLESQFPM